MFGKQGLAGLMKQAQYVQENMKKKQEALAALSHEGVAANGLVKVTMTGAHQVTKISIDPSLFTSDADDRETVEDLLVVAINDVVATIAKVSAEQMGEVTQGMNLPAGMKLPF
jgi:DNA-binding YbaB/EbfC family protein